MYELIPDIFNPFSVDGKRSPVWYIDETESTMSDARVLARDEAPSGSVIAAGYQNSGRGRIDGRRWESEHGGSLLFTVIFHQDHINPAMGDKPFTLLPLLCGIAAAEAIEEFAETPKGTVSIKWPNDVLADGRKICGILCEASGRFIYAGVGINLRLEKHDEGFRRPATSMELLAGSGKPVTSGAVLFSETADGPGYGPYGNRLLQLFLEKLQSTVSENQWQARLEKRLYRIGENVEFRTGMPDDFSAGAPGAVISGVLAGISLNGALLIDVNGKSCEYSSGELIV